VVPARRGSRAMRKECSTMVKRNTSRKMDYRVGPIAYHSVAGSTFEQIFSCGDTKQSARK
jgi:hypothetical protein